MNLDEKRQEANRELVNILKAEVEKRPTERFGQILRNCGFVQEVTIEPHLYRKRRIDAILVDPIIWEDEFSKEPWEILERVKESLR